MEEVAIRVREIHQTSSGGSHVVIFDALLLLSREYPNIDIELLSINPSDASHAHPEDISRALNAIRNGVEMVLKPKGLGAVVQVAGLVIHPTDFNPRRFETYTKRYLEGAFGEPVEGGQKR